MTMDAETIRREVSSWLSENWDPDLSLVAWRSKLLESGWGAPAWPTEYFGRGLAPSLVTVVDDEFAEIGALGAAHSGVRMLAAATLLEHANDEQKREYLRGIITGEDAWCQLFSEPGSGSDLAGATTRADRQGDEWVVNGQKVWTTSAHHADYGLLLARTDWDKPKHQGLTFFVLDMNQPGVDVRQLRQMNGHASFNEVFFTDARVPHANLVGTEGNGWQVAVTTLAHERRSFDRARGGGSLLERKGAIYDEYRDEIAVANEPYKWYPQRAGRVDLVIDRAVETGAINDPIVRQEIAKLLTMNKSAQWTAARARAAQQAGKPPGPEGSLGKLAASNVARLAARVHTMITGADAMLTGPDSPHEGVIAEILVSVPAVSIAGGTDEIQKNIIAERVLGLPKETRFDQGPFKDVPRNPDKVAT
jgi:alkylation response protein AidB-like acyl-CoA dehydrogenase